MSSPSHVLSNPLCIGILGCGHISGAHLKAWARVPDVRVAGVFDLNRELAEKRSREFNVPIAESLAQLIASSDVVDICTPPQTHAALASQVIAADKHLVLEKPVVTDLADWEKMVEQLKTSPSQIAVIHNMKVAEAVRQAKRWVDAGKIGTIIRIQREFLTSPAQDRMLVGDKHWSHSLPGGRWFETLPHELYLTHYFAVALPVSHVTALHTPDAPSGAPADEVLVTLKGERCIATIHFSAHCEQNRRVFTVQGTHGRIVVDILADYATLATGQDAPLRRALGGGVAFESGGGLVRWVPDRIGYGVRHAQGETPHSRIITMFANYLRGKGEHPTPFDEVDYVIRNCDRIGREIDRQLSLESTQQKEG